MTFSKDIFNNFFKKMYNLELLRVNKEIKNSKGFYMKNKEISEKLN